MDVSQSNPRNLNPHLSTNNGSISVEPMLLNAGEGFIIKTIASQYDSHVSIDARIKGIKQIEKPKPPLKAIGLFILSAYLAVIGTVQANISVDPETRAISMDFPGVLMMAIGYILFFGIISWTWFSQKKRARYYGTSTMPTSHQVNASNESKPVVI